jgi:cob(I)alamin adenosyltransferase
MPTFFTGKGDDGTTSLLGDERVVKSDIRPMAYGAIDEASAALGMARALAASEETIKITLRAQRDLYRIMAEVAATAENVERFRSIESDHVDWLEGMIRAVGERVPMPKGFILGGDSTAGAAYHQARTIVRRAERRVVALDQVLPLNNRHLLRYLNRLSSLCFVLSLWEDLQAGVDEPTLADPPHS